MSIPEPFPSIANKSTDVMIFGATHAMERQVCMVRLNEDVLAVCCVDVHESLPHHEKPLQSFACSLVTTPAFRLVNPACMRGFALPVTPFVLPAWTMVSDTWKNVRM